MQLQLQLMQKMMHELLSGTGGERGSPRVGAGGLA